MSVRETFGEKIASRKLGMTFLTEVIATGLLIAGLIEADHWVTVTITVVGAYLAVQAYVDKGN